MKKNIKKIFNAHNNKFEILFIFIQINISMEQIKQILEIQNVSLLRKIADDKFVDEEEKIKFIEKYNKINYKKFKIIYSQNNLINDYRRIADKI